MSIKEKLKGLKKTAAVGVLVGASLLGSAKEAKADATSIANGVLRFNIMMGAAKKARERNQEKQQDSQSVNFHEAMRKNLAANLIYPNFIPVKKDGTFDTEASLKMAKDMHLKENLPYIQAYYNALESKDPHMTESAFNELASRFSLDSKVNQEDLKSILERTNQVVKERETKSLTETAEFIVLLSALVGCGLLAKEMLINDRDKYISIIGIGTMTLPIVLIGIIGSFYRHYTPSKEELEKCFVEAHKTIYDIYKERQIDLKINETMKKKVEDTKKGYVITDMQTAKKMIKMAQKGK